MQVKTQRQIFVLLYFSFCNKYFSSKLKNTHSGSVFARHSAEVDNVSVFSLHSALSRAFRESHAIILVVKKTAMAVYHDQMTSSLYFFDSHSRDAQGHLKEEGTSVLKLTSLLNVTAHIQSLAQSLLQ